MFTTHLVAERNLIVKGVKMFFHNLENAQAFEVERHKDEMHDAAKHNLVHQNTKELKSTALPFVILSIITWILASLIW